MNSLYIDATYPDLIWVQFSGPTWDEFHQLITQFEQWLSTELDGDCYLVFYPEIDMPSGSPVPHIKRLLDIMKAEPRIVHIITVLPTHMRIARIFTNVTFKLFPSQVFKATLVMNKDEVHDAYRRLITKT